MRFEIFHWTQLLINMSLNRVVFLLSLRSSWLEFSERESVRLEFIRDL
jgi:hypothetical protein